MQNDVRRRSSAFIPFAGCTSSSTPDARRPLQQWSAAVMLLSERSAEFQKKHCQNNSNIELKLLSVFGVSFARFMHTFRVD